MSLTSIRGPFRRHKRFVVLLHDLSMAALSMPLALALRDGPEGLAARLDVLAYALPIFITVCAVSFATAGTHRALWHLTALPDLVTVAKAVTLVTLVSLALLFLVDRLEGVPRSVPLIQWFVLVVLLAGSRLLYASASARRRGAARERAAGPGWKPVLLVGAGEVASLIVEVLRRQRHPSHEVVGILDDRASCKGRAVHHVPVLGGLGDLAQVVDHLSIRGLRPSLVVVTRPRDAIGEAAQERLLASAGRLGLQVRDAGELTRLGGELTFEAAQDGEHAGPMRDFQARPGFAAKRAVDVVGAALLLLLCLPLMAMVAGLVWLDLGPPVTFRQARPGRGFRRFMLYKFRTLREDREGGSFLSSDRERQSLLGGVLRRTRLDELPQLYNVLRGDMSLIGPRPLLPRDLPQLGWRESERFAVRPGITGWAQVNGGNLLLPEEKLALDVWYIRNCSLLLDLWTAVLTVRMILFGERVNDRALRRAREDADPSASSSAARGALPTKDAAAMEG